MTHRIAHIITGLQTGGAELMLERLLAHRRQTDFDHIVICLTGDGPTANRIRCSGTPVHTLRLRPGFPNPLAIARIRKLLKSEHIDLVQTWLYHADLLGGLAARSLGLPVIWGMHRSNLDSAFTSRSVIWTAKTCRMLSGLLPARIVCCSEASVVAHREFGYAANKMTEIPNGFDLEQFHPDQTARVQFRQEIGALECDVVIGTIGRFVPLKNHHMFVTSAGRALAANPNLRFVLVGDGLNADATELMDWIAATGHPDRFYLLGRRSDTQTILNGLDGFALTSNTEAFPLVLGEAMACQVPCIATSVGDCARILGETGWIVPPGDSDACANAMLALAADPGERTRRGSAARARIASHFAIETIVGQYNHLWLNTLAGATS